MHSIYNVNKNTIVQLGVISTNSSYRNIIILRAPIPARWRAGTRPAYRQDRCVAALR